MTRVPADRHVPLGQRRDSVRARRLCVAVGSDPEPRHVDQPDRNRADTLAVVRVVRHVLAHRHAAGRAIARRSGRACRTSPAPAAPGTPGGRDTAAARPCRRRSPAASRLPAARSTRLSRQEGSRATRFARSSRGRRSDSRARRGSGSAPSTPRASSHLCAPSRRCTRSARHYHPPPMDPRTIVVLEGDETGQELLEEALRALAPDVIGIELAFPRFDLSLATPARDRERGRLRGCARRSASTASA